MNDDGDDASIQLSSAKTSSEVRLATAAHPFSLSTPSPFMSVRPPLTRCTGATDARVPGELPSPVAVKPH